MHGGSIWGTGQGPSRCLAWGTHAGFKPCLRKSWERWRMGEACRGLRECRVHCPGWKRAAGGGLRDTFNHYSQVKYQVVVALFGDAIVEPHCSRDTRVTGYTRIPPHSPGMPLLPFGHRQELGKGRVGLFLLPPPLATAVGWDRGVPTRWGTPAVAPGLDSSVRLKGHVQIRDCLGLVPGRGPRQLLGYLGCQTGCGCPQPSPRPIGRGAQAQGELSQDAGLPALAPMGLFLFSARDLHFLLVRSQVGDTQESPRDEFPLEEALPPSPPTGLVSHPTHHSRGTLSPWACLARYSQERTATLQLGCGYSGLDPCSWLSRQMCSQLTGTEAGRMYK